MTFRTVKMERIITSVVTEGHAKINKTSTSTTTVFSPIEKVSLASFTTTSTTTPTSTTTIQTTITEMSTFNEQLEDITETLSEMEIIITIIAIFLSIILIYKLIKLCRNGYESHKEKIIQNHQNQARL